MYISKQNPIVLIEIDLIGFNLKGNPTDVLLLGTTIDLLWDSTISWTFLFLCSGITLRQEAARLTIYFHGQCFPTRYWRRQSVAYFTGTDDISLHISLGLMTFVGQQMGFYVTRGTINTASTIWSYFSFSCWLAGGGPSSVVVTMWTRRCNALLIIRKQASKV